MLITVIINTTLTKTTVENVPYTLGMNAQKALQAAYNTVKCPPAVPLFTYTMGYTGSQTGYVVEIIIGLSPFSNKCWMPYIGGTVQSRYIDNITINDSDILEFKYEANPNEDN